MTDELNGCTDTEIKAIYDKAMIKRSQQEKELIKRRKEELEKNYWKYLNSRLEGMLSKIIKLYETPNISKQQIDTAQREFSNTLDYVNMHTLPEVIDELVLRESRAKFQVKLLNNSVKV